MVSQTLKQAGLLIVLLILTIGAGTACLKHGPRQTGEKFTVSTSSGEKRVDIELEGTVNHEWPRLSKDQFRKLANELERLTIEYGERGTNVVTVADEWGVVEVSSDTGSPQLRNAVAERIKNIENVRTLTLQEPQPIVEQVRAAMKQAEGQQRNRGGNNFRMAYIPLSLEKTRQAQTEGAVILDLRPRADFKREHIAGALNFPLNELSSRLSEIPSSELTILTFVEVRDPHNPTLRVSPSNDELNPLLKELAFNRKTYVAVLGSNLTEWKAIGYPTASEK